MLTQLGLKNFKLFGEDGVSLAFGKVTLLIGPNGSGKSTILQALLLLRQSLGHASLQTKGPYWNFGMYRDVVHFRDQGRVMGIEIASTYDGFPPRWRTSPRIPPTGTLEQSLTFQENGQVAYSRGTLSNDREILTCEWPGGDGPSADGGVELTEPLAGDFDLVGDRSIGRPVSLMTNEPVERASGRRLGDDLLAALGRLGGQIQNTHMVPAVRGFDEREYETIGPVSTDVLDSFAPPQNRAGRVANLLASEPGLGAILAERLSAIAPGQSSDLRTRLVADHYIAVELLGLGGATNLADEAFGLNQLIPLLVHVVKAEPGSVIGIEEPESHLHPRAQAALCDVLLKMATEQQQQLIFTTHSEHIAMALLTAVARGDLKADDLAIYEFRREGDSATAERLNVTEHGQVEGGLRTFFEVDIDQLGDFISARLAATRG